MPGRNQTGPNGMGPMTGRGMGVRTGMNQGVNFGLGRGFRRGRGNGFRKGMGQGYGYRNAWGQSEITSDVNLAQQTFLENELKIMKEQVATLERELKNIAKTNDTNS